MWHDRRKALHAEWVDGEVVMPPSPSYRHQQWARHVANLLEASLPSLVAEGVLSPATRAEDTVTKSGEYLAAGIGQYWLVDPASRVIEVFANAAGRWEPVTRVDEESPRVLIEVAPHGSVTVDLDTLL